jgi:tight adherence protein C
MELLITMAVFGLVCGLVYAVVAPRSASIDETIQRRLENLAVSSQARPAGRIRLYDPEEETLWERVARFFFGDREMPERFTRMSRMLHQAGYRGTRALRIFWGLRISLCLGLGFGLLLMAMLSGTPIRDLLMMVAAGALVGYMLPYITVLRKARARVLEMRESLPDTLDLLVVCVEAGMGMDAAINRVGKEQQEQKIALGEELVLASQEMQAGAPRREALSRMADRCGVEELQTLITFLAQTEEVGGSISRSLRVFAETMRDKRSQAAEEAARKAVIKLIFPLVFFILPVIFILVLGPPAMQIMKILSNPLG